MTSSQKPPSVLTFKKRLVLKKKALPVIRLKLGILQHHILMRCICSELWSTNMHDSPLLRSDLTFPGERSHIIEENERWIHWSGPAGSRTGERVHSCRWGHLLYLPWSESKVTDFKLCTADCGLNRIKMPICTVYQHIHVLMRPAELPEHCNLLKVNCFFFFSVFFPVFIVVHFLSASTECEFSLWRIPVVISHCVHAHPTLSTSFCLPAQVWLLHKGLQPAPQTQTCPLCQGWGWENTFLVYLRGEMETSLWACNAPKWSYCCNSTFSSLSVIFQTS